MRHARRTTISAALCMAELLGAGLAGPVPASGQQARPQFPVNAQAGPGFVDIHVSPEGSGNRDGRGAANAMPIAQSFRIAAVGGRAIRLILAPGTYDVSRIGSLRLPTRAPGSLVIEGSGDDTVLVGSHQPGSRPRAALFVLARSDVTFRNFAVRNVSSLIDIPNGATADRIVISGVAISDVHDGIVIDRGKKLAAQDWRIEDVRIARHFRVGIRLAGERTARIAIRRTTIDGGGEGASSDCFKGGIQLLEAVSDVTIEHVRVSNNIGCAQAKYQQGDGIEADDKQGAPQRITLRDVISSGNRDGNFDLKAENMVLEDLTSRSGGATRYGFRFWHFRYDCVRCRLEGEGGEIQVINSVLLLRDPTPADGATRIRCGDGKTREPSVYRSQASGRTSPESVCAQPK